MNTHFGQDEQQQRPRERDGDRWGRPVLLVLYRAAVLGLLVYVALTAARVNAGLDALARLGESLP